ncbi:glycine--tRNA ligase subunit beta [Arenicella sp. 4NH20-0111]|uniref:glycine--tRNA ligase subunit beta n=1 Tax=Arenicella sp. 4NH20-0111 TaxID=3127648 RepID=UPI00310912D0
MSSRTLLIELGTEELPPKALLKLSDAFTREITSGLLGAQLITESDAQQTLPYATPRRLAVSTGNVLPAQPDQVVERRGPAVQAAFNAEGQATPAALGFAKSCGVEVEELERLKTDKGEWLSYNLVEKGKTLEVLIQEILAQAIKRLPIPKRMRWGAGDAEFVRPLKWLIVMHGNEIIPATALDITSSNETRGHRFHSQGPIAINNADNYESVLLDQGHVIADFAKRRQMISDQATEAALSVGGTVEEDTGLLDEVTGLVEYPSPILGSFDDDFLDVPQECLVSSMRDHQKYFHVIGKDKKLIPYFITISNIESKNPEQVKTGNEKVLRARLSDAQFFWETDQKSTLESRIDRLKSVRFHAKLGNLYERTKRIEALAGELAAKMNGSVTDAKRGALLAKADLVSDMVGEFDELQGIMGHYYADREGEPSIVGDCIEQHYWPKFAGDSLPVSNEAQAVALADRIDSFVGLFGAGERPTGDKDPYALRRAALSILRILIEREHSFSIPEIVKQSVNIYAEYQSYVIDSDTQKDIVEFILGRLTALYQSQDIARNTINAVMACKPEVPLDFEHRVKAVHAFNDAAEAADLASANKRISNLLKKQKQAISSDVEPSLLSEDAEKQLFNAICEIESECTDLFSNGDYAQGLNKLASLRSPVDDFFEHVMVMSEDEAQRNNRLALLKKLQSLFLQVADIALLS